MDPTVPAGRSVRGPSVPPSFLGNADWVLIADCFFCGVDVLFSMVKFFPVFLLLSIFEDPLRGSLYLFSFLLP